ncbi:hypothetical protein [Streptomyces sp. WM6372]|uniref:hypothetical protein n=1 Tax=Streptomyces sp. WM6372 TaxID=1415555 RepID=UPI0006AE6176|nr:hypothetical protein [Streptomyces sp. WM6372]
MRTLRAVAAVLLSAVVLAGCGSGGGGSEKESGSPPTGGSGTASASASDPASASTEPSPGPGSPGATGAPPGKPTDSASASSVPVSPGPSSALERLVTVTRTGGYAGKASTLLVKGDGSWTRLDRQMRPAGTGKLPADRGAKLRTALARADLARLPRFPTGGPAVFDGFVYTFVHGGYEVTVAQESLTPALRDVLDELPAFEEG